MQWKQYLHQKPFQVVLLVFAILVLKEIVYVSTFAGKVSPIADGYSEANTIRGAMSFRDLGFSKYKGLPDIFYSDLLPDEGVAAAENLPQELKTIPYTHYPPGPEYLAWLGFHVVGFGNFTLLRFLPLTLSVLIGFFFLKTMFALVGGGQRGLIFCLMLILPPMYANFMHGLHHQQYAFLMLQLQMCLAVRYFTGTSHKGLLLTLFALLGFCQGWMTFDYAFLATLFIIPFYFYFSEQSRFRDLVGIGLASGLSYTAAHLLHFYQVVSWYGDVKLALADLTDTASYRATNTHIDPTKKGNIKYDPKEIGPFTVAKDFLYRVAGRGKYLSINLINFIWIIIGLRFVRRLQFKKGWVFEFDVRNTDLLALFASVVVSAGWSLVMKQHAHIHGFIARHYYFCFFFCCLILITRTKRIPDGA